MANKNLLLPCGSACAFDKIRKSAYRYSLIIGLTVLLSACAAKPGMQAGLHLPGTPVPVLWPSQSSKERAPTPAQERADKNGADGQSSDAALAPADLKTLSRKELLSRYGQPDFTRHDPPAEIWQYRSTACVLDVFLYPAGDDLHVAHAVTRDPTSPKTTSVYCSPFAAQHAVAG